MPTWLASTALPTKALEPFGQTKRAPVPARLLFRLSKTARRRCGVKVTGCDLEPAGHRSQIVTGSQSGGRRYLPYAFTEHGAIMAANVLNSPRAVQMSVFVVRAFVKMRAALTDTRELARKLAAVEAELKSRLDVHEVAIVEVLQRIMKILDPPPPPPEPPPPEIGFHVKEDAVPYRIKRRPVRAGAGQGGSA